MADLTKITGLAELSRALKELPRAIAGQVLGSAVASGAGVIRTAARAGAPELSGLTKKATVAYRNKQSTQERIIYNVGVTLKMKSVGEVITGSRKKIHLLRMGGAQKPRNARYWFYNEFGSKHQKAKPFIRPAFADNQAAVLERIKTRLAEAIDKAAAKLGGK